MPLLPAMVSSSPGTATGNEKEVVRDYFNGTGFERHG